MPSKSVRIYPQADGYFSGSKPQALAAPSTATLVDLFICTVVESSRFEPCRVIRTGSMSHPLVSEDDVRAIKEPNKYSAGREMPC